MVVDSHLNSDLILTLFNFKFHRFFFSNDVQKLSQEFFVLGTFPAVNLRGSLTITTSYAVVDLFFLSFIHSDTLFIVRFSFFSV